MTKLNELNLGENDQIRSKILELFSTWKVLRPGSYPSSSDLRRTELFDNVNTEIYEQLNLLAKNSPADLKLLLSAEVESQDNISYSILFSEFLNSEQKHKDIFLFNCTALELITYVKRSSQWLDGFCHAKYSDKEHNVFFIKLKSFISESIEQINQHKSLDSSCADKLSLILIELLVSTYKRLNPHNTVKINKKTKIRDRDYCIKEISKILTDIKNVNGEASYHHKILWKILILSDYKNDHSDLIKNMLYSLVERGIAIEKCLDDAMGLKICGNENITYEFWSKALAKNQSISVDAIKKSLDLAVEYGNGGAIRALYENLSKNNSSPEKFAYTNLLVGKNGVKPETLDGVLIYLSIADSSVYEMLEYVANNQPSDKKILLQNLFGKFGGYTETTYAKYEAGEQKNVFYYFAQQPERCLEEINFYNSFTTKEMIIKSDPDLCPLALAIKKHNVVFLLFVLDIMKFKISNELANKIIAGAVELIEQDVDIKSIIKQLKQSVSEYPLLCRWMSYEYKILSAIKNKLNPGCLLWQSRKPKPSSEQETKQRLVLV